LYSPEPKDRGTRVQPNSTTLPATPIAGSAEETSIRQLMAHGKSKTALDRAKDLHKSSGSAASEALLIDAYASRIQALLDQNLTLEAKSLLELVCSRYPAAKPRLAALSAKSSARTGAMDELLGPLADADLDADRRAAIEQAVQNGIVDLAAIAVCAALPADHSLRVAAAAIDRAFAAVTSGTVTDVQIALPEVSRRSPLGSWKLLVRAIAYFYRGEDGACRECLDAIKPESVPARLIPAIRSLLGAKPAAPLTPLEVALVSRVSQSSETLHNELEKLDHAFAEEAESPTLKLIRSAMQECRRSAPEQVETLKRLIWARGAGLDMDSERMISALQGMPRQDATFFRTLAHRMETTRDFEDLGMACEFWDEFRQHAVREGWFDANGVEVATLYLHMAGLLRRVPYDMLEELQQEGRSDRKRLGLDDSYFLFPEKLYERSCAIDPHPESFSLWLKWAEAADNRAVDVAKEWHKIRPTDIEPLLFLMQDAEKREAYPSALTYLDKAESIDAVHSVVRAARLRLLAAGALRHLRQKKPHLAVEKLKTMAALPQSKQGDRPAFLAALRYLIGLYQDDAAAMNEARAESARLLGSDIAGGMLASGVAIAGKALPIELPRVTELTAEEQLGLPVSIAKVVAVAKDLGIVKFKLPFEYVVEAAKQFPKVRDALEIGQLRSLAEAAMAGERFEFAYSVSGEGLRRGGPTEARFLVLRARSLPGHEGNRHAVCAAAAAELARSHRDDQTVGEAVDLVRAVFGPDSFSLTLDQAAEVVRKEIAASAYPTWNSRGPDYSALLPVDTCDCPACRRKRGEIPDPFFGEDDGDDDEELDEEEFDEIFNETFNGTMPPGMPPELAPMMSQIMREAFISGMSPAEVIAELKKLARSTGSSRGIGKKGKRK
jgi:hypothetical protein